MGLNITITAPKLKEQALKFSKIDASVKKHGTSAMNEAVRLSKNRWREVAAFETGLYQNTLQTEVKPIAGNIIQGAVRTFAQSGRGFPYPRALEDSVRYHYRSTRRKGQRTAGQVTRMFLRLRPMINRLFNSAKDRIIKDLVVR